MLTVYCRPVHDDRGYQDDYWGPGDPLLTRVGAPGYPDHDTRPGHAGQVGAPGYPDHDTRQGYPGQDPGYHDPYHQSGLPSSPQGIYLEGKLLIKKRSMMEAR